MRAGAPPVEERRVLGAAAAPLSQGEMMVTGF
jgi:hypothetical protein